MFVSSFVIGGKDNGEDEDEDYVDDVCTNSDGSSMFWLHIFASIGFLIAMPSCRVGRIGRFSLEYEGASVNNTYLTLPWCLLIASELSGVSR